MNSSESFPNHKKMWFRLHYLHNRILYNIDFFFNFLSSNLMEHQDRSCKFSNILKSFYDTILIFETKYIGSFQQKNYIKIYFDHSSLLCMIHDPDLRRKVSSRTISNLNCCCYDRIGLNQQCVVFYQN